MVTVRHLLALREGHLLTFDFPVDRPIELLVNGTHKYSASIVSAASKRACLVEKIRPGTVQGMISEEPTA